MTVDTLMTVISLIESLVSTVDDSVATEDTTDGDPFKVLISCILSQRTKEEITTLASSRLFARASSPYALISLSEEEIGSLIYPVGFWKTKAHRIRHLSSRIIESHHGQVPSTMEGLLSLPGVGRKTANLVLSVGFGIPAICVDTHVHRIMNRLGFVSTSTPEETEFTLRRSVPICMWNNINYLLVVYGRNVCVPISPKCTKCPVDRFCQRVGVIRFR